MAALSKDDGTRDGHFECQACAANQANAVHSARLARHDARRRKTATAALCTNVCGQSLGLDPLSVGLAYAMRRAGVKFE
jgi:hypothetical protein